MIPPAEGHHALDTLEVPVLLSNLDVMQVEFVLADGRGDGSVIGAGPLIAVLAIDADVFFATVFLNDFLKDGLP